MDINAVSKTLRIISFYNIKFAIRSGGHSLNPGFSSVGKDGILIDMQRLNAINLSEDKLVASIGPGARWGAVMKVMDSSRVFVVGGRLTDIGVGGLLLGGK